MATTTSKLGLTKPSYTDAADVGVLNSNFDILDREVSKRTRVRNLLDNSDFRNPVNQRGITNTTTDSTYIIDRWRVDSQASNGKVSIGSNGIVLEPAASSYCGIYQCCDRYTSMKGKVYTIALLVNNVWESHTFTMGSQMMGLDFANGLEFYSIDTAHALIRNRGGNASITVQCAALYEGSYTADTLPEYQPKGYAAELAECQRYCLRMQYGVISGISLGATTQLVVPTPVTMRIEAPTFSEKQQIYVYGADGTTAPFQPTSTINVGYGVRIVGTLNQNLGNKPCVVPDFDGYLFADL